MVLFTSSSDPRIKKIVLTLVIGLAVFALYNFAIWKIQRDDPGGSVAGHKFWIDKIYPKQRYNAIFLGDSRCMNGIDPSHLEKKLGKPAFNSGFLSGGLNKTIFEHVEKKLLATSPAEPRCVIFSVTPVSISTMGYANEHFKSLFKSYKNDTPPDPSFGKDIFKRLNIKEIGILWGDGLSRSICHENGWCEMLREVRKRSQRRALRYYKGLMSTLKFEQKNMDELLAQTKQWKKNNITVFAFYIPSTPALEEMELTIAKWDLNKFKKQFRDAGGIFLEISNRETYNAYDAVHLHSKDATRLSKELADKIHAHYAKK